MSLKEVCVTWAAIGHFPAASDATMSITWQRSANDKLQNSPIPQVQPPPVVPRSRAR